ncbi:YsnF/AvaK domain-containing protein [Pontibacter beigongshangensis]|uniref:YsnF/AvaK domain-containing protein n=1 Tax=Pontibacter beigongshangensis TaxID=2574733 RepID=UPI00165026D1|nr:YsnF/AvaK domain-containing protein [Pontibacter beigongshangensis]
MNKNNDNKLKSEFEQKLQGRTHQTQHLANLSRPDAAPDLTRNQEPEQVRIQRKTDDLDDNQERTIPIVEEHVEIGKRVVETADVYISKSVHEDHVTVDLPTTREHVDIERVPINQYVEAPPAAVRYEGDKMIIPVLREELVVVKKLFVVEELHITKKRETTHESEEVTLQKEELHVNRVDKSVPRP